jgi:flagellar motor switch protein FliN/FliY
MIAMTNEAAKMRLITCFSEALQQSVSVERGGEWLCIPSAVAPATIVPAAEVEVLVMSVRLRGTLHGEVRVELGKKQATVLMADDDGGSPKDIRRIWLALMEGVVKYLPKRVADAGIFAFSVESHHMIELSAEGVQIGRMELSEVEGRSAMLYVLADEELVESLNVAEWSAFKNTVDSGNGAQRDPQLGRVIDVPLAVTLRFGQRQMRLREVLELNTGTLVELDRQVEEPVDLMLGERVIARGEVVIVDGNYGLRVTEIVERNPMPGL